MRRALPSTMWPATVRRLPQARAGPAQGPSLGRRVGRTAGAAATPLGAARMLALTFLGAAQCACTGRPGRPAAWAALADHPTKAAALAAPAAAPCLCRAGARSASMAPSMRAAGLEGPTPAATAGRAGPAAPSRSGWAHWGTRPGAWSPEAGTARQRPAPTPHATAAAVAAAASLCTARRDTVTRATRGPTGSLCHRRTGAGLLLQLVKVAPAQCGCLAVVLILC